MDIRINIEYNSKTFLLTGNCNLAAFILVLFTRLLFVFGKNDIEFWVKECTLVLDFG